MSRRSDLSGEWAVLASLGGVPVRMWITLMDPTSGTGAGDLNGELRIADDMPGDPARVVFETNVDADGYFEVWLPRFVLDLPALSVAGDLLCQQRQSRGAVWTGCRTIDSTVRTASGRFDLQCSCLEPADEFPVDIVPSCPSDTADAGRPG